MLQDYVPDTRFSLSTIKVSSEVYGIKYIE